MGSVERRTAETGNGDSQYTVPFCINGKEVHPRKSFDVVSPATGKVVHRCGSAGEAEVDAAVDAASEAFKSWKNSTPNKRRGILLKAVEVMERRREELVKYQLAETGALEAWADSSIDTAKNLLLDTAGRIATLEGSVLATQDPDIGALVLREPFGVVLAMAPWNSPYILGIRSVVLPIAAGNTAVLRGSELSPRCMWAICSVLHQAGLPAGVLNLIVHAPEDAAHITQLLVAKPEVKKLNFTGSTAVGRIIAKLAGEHLKPVLLELGGKAPAIVWEDADLDNAAFHCMLGSFINSGQVCMSTERILVHKNVRDRFEEKLARAIDQLFDGSKEAPVLINTKAVDKNKTLLQDAINKGARLIYGNIAAEETCKTRMRPIVVGGIKTDMDIFQTESFGPIVSLFDIETEEEALKMANDTEYGLSSAVFTEDLRRGLRLARGIETGAVHINRMSVHDESTLPHGGAKSSGYGRFNASEMAEWTRTKSITYKY